MGFASGRVSFRRFRISGPHPKRVDDDVIEALRGHAFGVEEVVSADGVETGWIAPTHLFDTAIDAGKVVAGPYLHVVMRLDNTSAPAAVVRSYRRMEEAAALEASGEERLSKEERRQAKEQAEAKAAKEARQGRFRRFGTHPVFIDFEDGVVYFASLGGSAGDKLRRLFAETFEAALEPLDAAETASILSDQLGRHRSYEDAVAAHLVDAPAGGSGGNGSADAVDRSFLGREFLSWLWHGLETSDGSVALRADGRRRLPKQAGVVFQKLLQLDCDFQATGRNVLYADGPTRAPEVRAALRVGKQPVKAGLLMAVGPDEYSFVLDAARWQVNGLELPECEEVQPTARLEERCGHIVRLSAALDAMLAGFLDIRFGSDFAGAWGRVRQWAAPGRKAASATARQEPDDQPSLRLAR